MSDLYRRRYQPLLVQRYIDQAEVVTYVTFGAVDLFWIRERLLQQVFGERFIEQKENENVADGLLAHPMAEIDSKERRRIWDVPRSISATLPRLKMDKRDRFCVKSEGGGVCLVFGNLRLLW